MFRLPTNATVDPLFYAALHGYAQESFPSSDDEEDDSEEC